MIRSSLARDGASKLCGRREAAQAIAPMRALDIVEMQVAIEGALQRRTAGEVVPTEGNAPVLMQDRPLDRSTKPLVQACRGFVRVTRICRWALPARNAPLNSCPPSVSTRCKVQPAAR